MNMENEQMAWQEFGDVHPFEHGGGWARKIGEHEWEVVYLTEGQTEEQCTFEVLTINLMDTWLKQASVADTCDWNLGTTELQRAVDCIWYHGAQNFGGSGNADPVDIEEAKKLVRGMGIIIEGGSEV
jgi:hypothetical protein